MKNQFVKHVLTLMKGTAIAQFLPILISPILTRIYTPEQFGLFAIYIAIISVLTPIISGRYELAIALPKDERKALALFYLTFLINICVTLVTVIIVMSWGQIIMKVMSLQDENLLYLLPIGLFLTGLLSSFTYLNNRWGRFDSLAHSKISQSIGMAIAQMVIGLAKLGSLGLLIGYCFGQVASLISLNKKAEIPMMFKKERIHKNTLVLVGKEYNEFPKYAMITHSTEALSANIPSFLLSKFFGTQFTGYYSLTTRTISLPLSLIGKAVGDVFLSTASKLYREQGECKELYKKTFKVLALIPIIPFVLMLFFAEELFSFVFGEEWGIAGTYTKILLPALYLQFISNPLSHMFVIAKKIKIEFLIQFIILILSILAFVVGYFYFKSSLTSLLMFSGVLVLKYIIFIVLSYKFSQANQPK
ncbi:polysaccharide biosynthesis protein [Sporosarcina sp. NCCP-2222]|uniref:lipopolysaccharide biosynthesis protein n=1 Tax=Sporosarcina sp. NCCP-2222 TaxID=2935073 RepID=UPI00207F58E6|nr:oligosaccharide flippase family protein [Sporosarcina sp. NCCP-2222]GKV57404.1 polysaccharide biosynthesis protein [Sporosarcina sp. NCCP-2222]